MDGFGPLLGQNYKNNNDFMVFELCSVFFSRNGKVQCNFSGKKKNHKIKFFVIFLSIKFFIIMCKNS